MMRFSFLLLLLPLLIGGCTDPADPGPSPGTPSSSAIAVTRLTDLPMIGGNVADVTIAPDNTTIAVIDGKLYTLPASGGVPVLAHGDAEYTQVMATQSGQIYALTTTDLRVFDDIGAGPRLTTLDVANRFVEGVRMLASPSGEPYVAINSYPAGMAVYTSTDGGTTWEQIGMPGGAGARTLRYGTGLAFTPSGDLLVTNYEGLYKSTDRGVTWTTLTTDMATFGSGFQLFVASNGDIYRYMAAVGNLGVSRNGGTSFTAITPYNRPPLILELREGADGSIYAITRAGELLRLKGNGTWELRFLCGSCESIEARGERIVLGQGTKGGGAGGLFLSANGGAEWSASGLGATENIQDIGFGRGGELLLLADNMLLRKGAAGWKVLGAHGTFNRFASAPGGEFLVGGTTRIYHSTDDGASWREDSLQGPPFGGSNDVPGMPVLLGRRRGGFILSSAFININTKIPSTIFLFDTDPYGHPRRINAPGAVTRVVEDVAGTLYTSVMFQDGITYQFYSEAYQSNDGGTTWQLLGSGVSANGRPAGAAAFNSANGYVSAGGSTGLWFSRVTQEQPTELKLLGGPPQVSFIRAWFGPDDRLYLLAQDRSLLVSQDPVK